MSDENEVDSLWARLMSGEIPDLGYRPEDLCIPDRPGNVSSLREYKRTHDLNVRNAIVLDNMRLVYDAIYVFTKRRALRRNAKGRTSDPLVSAGVCGLIRAIELFDVDRQQDTRNGLFVVYARLHIRHELQQAALQDMGMSRRTREMGLTKLDLQEIMSDTIYPYELIRNGD